MRLVPQLGTGARAWVEDRPKPNSRFGSGGWRSPACVWKVSGPWFCSFSVKLRGWELLWVSSHYYWAPLLLSSPQALPSHLLLIQHPNGVNSSGFLSTYTDLKPGQSLPSKGSSAGFELLLQHEQKLRQIMADRGAAQGSCS